MRRNGQGEVTVPSIGFRNWRTVGSAMLLAGLLLAARGAPAQSLQAERADDWEALFRRTSGWTGADGIYSIPLTGDDSSGGLDTANTLFVFSDTFIGDVAPGGMRLSGTQMVNNTVAVMPAGAPDPDRIHFFWRTDGNGDAGAVLVPRTAQGNPGDWYWPLDGLALGGKVHIFAQRMREGDGGVFNFVVDGVALITLDQASATPLRDHVQTDAPLFLAPGDGRGELIFGAAVMANTAAAGAPAPDGYIYVYGTQNDPFVKKMLVARVRPERFADFTAWRYWDGGGWVRSLASAVPVAARISSEFSVTPLPDGRVVAIFQLDALGRDVAAAIGQGPAGPFGPPRTLWTAPEPALDPDIYTYNAKAHPHLSRPGELIVSYNVNTFDFADHFTHAGIYRPRFIRVRLPR